MQAGPMVWLILLTVGVAALGLVMALGATRNGKRTRAEQIETEVATKQEYRAESRDHS